MTLDLSGIEARVVSTTPGPWKSRGGTVRTHEGLMVADCGPSGLNGSDEDAAFIANAPSDIVELLAAVYAVRNLMLNWQMGYGPDSKAENVFGKQVVSVEFVTETVLKMLGGDK